MVILKLCPGGLRVPAYGRKLSRRRKRNLQFILAEIAINMSAAVCFKDSALGVL